MSVNTFKVFISYFFLLYWYKFKLFFVFFTPAVSFWAFSFLLPKLTWLVTELLCLKLTTEGWWCPPFFKKTKHENFSFVCAIYALNLRCVFSLFLYTHFKEIKVHLFFIISFLLSFCCRTKTKVWENFLWPVNWLGKFNNNQQHLGVVHKVSLSNGWNGPLKLESSLSYSHSFLCVCVKTSDQSNG